MSIDWNDPRYAGCYRTPISANKVVTVSSAPPINWQARAEAAEAQVARLRAERNLAYGYLWCMNPDDRNPGLGLARRARETLLAGMEKEEQRAGIEAARTALEEPSQ